MKGCVEPEIWNLLTFIDHPLCFCCGSPLEYSFEEELTDSTFGGKEVPLCFSCHINPPITLDQLRSALIYDDISRKLVLELKYAERRDTLTMIAQLMIRVARTILDRNSLLVPVPLHWSRLLERRYNQSTILAREIASRTGLPISFSILKRKSYTENQGGKSFSARQKNVQKAFEVSEKDCLKYQHKTITLIDDVMTTGATLDACARALKRGGIQKVNAITLLRVAVL